jgi:hypothetical protein
VNVTLLVTFPVAGALDCSFAGLDLPSPIFKQKSAHTLIGTKNKQLLLAYSHPNNQLFH